MNSVTLYRIDQARNMQRFYRLDIQPDLFGNQCLIREWGRIGRGGQMRSIPCRTEEEAGQAFHRQREIKERRGYVAYPLCANCVSQVETVGGPPPSETSVFLV